MPTASYTLLEEEIISTSLQKILHTLKIHHLISERIGLEIALQSGRIYGSNLNFYKTSPDRIGHINCIAHALTEHEQDHIRSHLFDILRILNVQIPMDVFGHIELIAEYDPVRRMRIGTVSLNLRSSFKLAVA